MGLQVESRRQPSGTGLVEVGGRLDLETLPFLQMEIAGLLEQGTDRIVIDVSRLDFVDSAGMAVFFSARNRLRAAGGRLALAAPGDNLARILDRTGLVRIVPVYPSLEQALAEMEPPEPT